MYVCTINSFTTQNLATLRKSKGDMLHVTLAPLISLLLRYRVYNDTLNAFEYSMNVLVRINVLPRIFVVLLYLLNEGLVLGHSFTYR